MNYQLLDTFLRELTSREKEYLKSSSNQKFFSQFETTLKNGIQCYILSLSSQLLIQNKLAISKQTRYSDVPMHIHGWIELNYMYSGSCIQQINHTSYELKAGQILLIDKDTPHSVSAASDQDILINILIREEYLSPQFLSRLASGIVSNFLINAIDKQKNHDNFIVFNTTENRRIHVLLKELLCEYFDPSLNSNEMLESYLSLIFLELINEYETSVDSSQLKFSNDYLIPILRYIEQNFKTCTLELTARHFNLHPNYLTTLLKKVTGMSYKELVREQRFRYATHLLKTTNLSITTISQEVGYENITFFYKKFKDAFNCTPSQYRKNNLF